MMVFLLVICLLDFVYSVVLVRMILVICFLVVVCMGMLLMSRFRMWDFILRVV